MPPVRYHLLMHFVVLIYGFTGILGALIELGAIELVWHRMGIATAGIAAYLFLFTGQTARVPRGDLLRLLGIGFLIALHWVAFFAAIKVSTVSVTLGCMASASLFTAFLEPLFFQRRLKLYEVFLGTIVVAGLWTIYRYESHYIEGILLALLASFSAALFTVINARMIRTRSAGIISFYEMMGGVIGISIYLLVQGSSVNDLFSMTSNDLIWLLILGLICTAFAFMASVFVMKRLTPFSVSLTINMEPVYGILLAFLIFGEDERMSGGFYLGTLMILLALFVDVWKKNSNPNKNSNSK